MWARHRLQVLALSPPLRRCRYSLAWLMDGLEWGENAAIMPFWEENKSDRLGNQSHIVM